MWVGWDYPKEDFICGRSLRPEGDVDAECERERRFGKSGCSRSECLTREQGYGVGVVLDGTYIQYIPSGV